MSYELRMSMKQDFEFIKERMKSVKEEFKEYIVNPAFTLEERWDFFLRAPDFVVNRSNYIVHFDSLESIYYTNKAGSHKKLSEQVVEAEHRGYQIDVDNILDQLESIIEEAKEEGSSDDKHWTIESRNNAKRLVEAGLGRGTIDAFKEEAMAKNIRSFDFDW